MKEKKLKAQTKAMTYVMQQDVQNAIQLVMERHGIATITKAINYCIVNHLLLVEELLKEQSESNKLFHEKMAIEDASSRLIKALREMDKHTKTSLGLSGDPGSKYTKTSLGLKDLVDKNILKVI